MDDSTDSKARSCAGRNALLAERLEVLAADHAALQKTAAALKDQLDWFKRQLFGRRSEKRLECDLSEQASLFESLGAGDVPADPADARARQPECLRETSSRVTSQPTGWLPWKTRPSGCVVDRAARRRRGCPRLVHGADPLRPKRRGGQGVGNPTSTSARETSDRPEPPAVVTS